MPDQQDEKKEQPVPEVSFKEFLEEIPADEYSFY